MSVDRLLAHLGTGVTHTCHCWSVTRRDGRRLGFTDHDRVLAFQGITFSPASGLSAKALASTTGLSVNNTEAIGVLSSDAITEADINAGRYDGAEVVIWLVCWDDVSARKVLFRGSLGEITRASGGFQAELLGLTDRLNQPQGRSYLKTCSAVLGDGRCGFALDHPSYQLDYTLGAEVVGPGFALRGVAGFNEGWFVAGHIKVLTGAAAGLTGVIKSDTGLADRQITLWTPFALPIKAGDRIRLRAGCDKQARTCREKFANFLNFQGFPDMPGDDWLVSVPRSSQRNGGGSLTR